MHLSGATLQLMMKKIHGFLTDPDIDELGFNGNIDSIHLGTVSNVSKETCGEIDRPSHVHVLGLINLSKFSDLPQHNEITTTMFFTKINLS